MYAWISRNLFYMPIQAFRHERIRTFMAAIAEFEREPKARQEILQSEMLRDLLAFAAANNPYYSRIFREFQVDLARGDPESELRKIPLLTKSLLRENFRELISTPRIQTTSRHTSGSTGTPLCLVKDHDATAYMDAYMYQVYSWYGIEIGSHQARVWGMPFGAGNHLITHLKDMAMNRRRLVAFDLSSAQCKHYYRTLMHFRPYFMYGLIHSMYGFALQLEQLRLDPVKLGLQVIITTGEQQQPALKEYLERVFQCRVVDEYGCTESGIIAFECPQGKMHIATHNIFVELIDPQTGKPALPGEVGEVVITELHSHAFPLIRYRLGDLAKSETGRCSCGRNTPVLSAIVGRVAELIRTPDGRNVAAAVIGYAIPCAVRRYRTVQHALDRLTICLLCDQPLDSHATALIRTRIQGYLGEDMQIDIKFVDQLPIERSGKLRCFISELPHCQSESSVQDVHHS